MPDHTNGHLVLIGATASGKSALALEVSRRRPGVELVSMDSMAVYRGMDIGTATPGTELRAEVPHHLLDLADPSEEFTVSMFREAAGNTRKHALPLLAHLDGIGITRRRDDLRIGGPRLPQPG